MASEDDKEQPVTPVKDENNNREAETISPSKEEEIVEAEEEMKEAGENEEATPVKVDGENSKKKNKRMRAKLKKKKKAGAKTPAKESESKTPIKSGAKLEGKGLIFMCNSKTKQDCYRYNVLGLPPSKKDIVLSIYKGMRLFLYDFDSKLMHGIYKAAGPGGYNIEPKAFNSAYPSQVRFEVMNDCAPLDSEKFKPAIKDNYTSKNKFNFELTSKQVKDLCKIFYTSSEKGGYGSGGRILERRDRAPIPREPVYYPPPPPHEMVVDRRVVRHGYYSQGGPVYVREDPRELSRYSDGSSHVYREPYPLSREVVYPVYQEPVYTTRYDSVGAAYGYRYERPY